MVIKEMIKIPELSGDKARRVYYYLPAGYEGGCENYPVLYMFDGHNVFFDADATYGKCWGMKEYMDREKAPLIIVAVECNHEGNSRLCEYSPWPFLARGFGQIQPRAQIYMDWMVQTLKPMVDRRFRTKPQRAYTYICGSSMGGLMALFAICQYNPVFSRAAALSPSLWVAPAKLVRMIRETSFLPDTNIYIDYGSEEMSSHSRIPEALKRTAGAFLDRQICFSMRIVPGGQHCEASWERQIPVFMRCLDLWHHES